ncbi:uncharacterized protein LOC118453089 isoform X2 [Egretta garzetta]|uniref:uncharacterized protein LOC118453089 isoform X2 n=1 Tax=Egretta garzetta TaxID=188379 RepID=UPI00163BCD97|nr:uncharacterized protein LOC118453089 isoform X2 [Egretta garzetta]
MLSSSPNSLISVPCRLTRCPDGGIQLAQQPAMARSRSSSPARPPAPRPSQLQREIKIPSSCLLIFTRLEEPVVLRAGVAESDLLCLRRLWNPAEGSLSAMAVCQVQLVLKHCGAEKLHYQLKRNVGLAGGSWLTLLHGGGGGEQHQSRQNWPTTSCPLRFQIINEQCSISHRCLAAAVLSL